jgi:glutamate racemase
MIGIFDSGVGGLTVVRAVMEYLPGYDIIYLGDTARTPYGSKSPETVMRYALQDTEFLVEQGARIIVIACNTASSIAFGAVTVAFDVPVFEVITPAVSLSLETSKKLRIGVIGTRATINSGVYEKKIKALRPGAVVYSRACPLLVPLVEEGWQRRPETKRIVKKYLHPLRVRQIDALILGCTHYPLLKEVIQIKIGLGVHIIDSSLAVAGRLKNFIQSRIDFAEKLRRSGDARFFVTDVTEQFERIARSTLKCNVGLQHVRLG